MKKYIIAICLAIASAVSVLASNTNRVATYTGVSGVVGFLGDFETRAGIEINAGVVLNEHHYVEAEFIAVNSATKYGDSFNVRPILLSYKYEFAGAKQLSYYGGFSAGVMPEKLAYTSWSQSDTPFVYGVKAGAKWRFQKDLSLDLGGTVLRVQRSDVTTEGNIGFISLGFTYLFD